MIRCIHVISDTNIGGAGKMLLEFIRNDAWKGLLQLSVVVPQGSLLIPELGNIPVFTMEKIGKRSLALDAVPALTRLFKSQKPAIIHTHASLAARLAARLAGIPAVHTRHSAFTLPGHAKRFPHRQVSGLINSMLSTRIISVSPAATQNLIDAGTNPNLIDLVYNGVAPLTLLSSAERTSARTAFGLSQNEFVAALIARLSPEKGHSWLLDAAKLLKKANAGKPQSIRIAIAGNGKLEQSITRRIQDEGLDNVSFLGFIPDVWRLENAADVLLNTSIGAEATSLSLLEGLSLGRPAIVSDSFGNPYVIQDGKSGLVVPAGDTQALASALIRLRDEPALYTKLAHGARLEYETRFQAGRMVEETISVYEKALNIQIAI